LEFLEAAMNEQNHYIYEFGPFRLDAQKRVLSREGNPIKLFPKEFDTLLALVERSGAVLDKDELMRRVWGEVVVEESNLTTNISHLRKILGEKPNQHDYIVTVPGRGYLFVAGVRAAFDEVIVREHTRVTIEQEESSASSPDGGLQIMTTSAAALPYTQSPLPQPNHEQLSTAPSSLQQLKKPRPRALVAVGLLCIALGLAMVGLWLSKKGQTGNPVPFQQLTIAQLTTSTKATIAALSPDARFFVYANRIRGLESLLLGQVEGGEPIELRAAADVTYRSLKFSPDSSSIYYVVTGGEYERGALCKIAALGGVPEKLRENVSSKIDFAPDMKQFAHLRSSALIIGSTSGNSDRELISRPENLSFRAGSLSWSPDGKLMAIGASSSESGGRYEVFVVSVADGQIKRLTSMAWRDLLNIAWLPDGSGLVVVAEAQDEWDNVQLWHVSTINGTANKIAPDLEAYGSSISVSSDGGLLAAIQEPKLTSIWVGPADNLSQAKQVTFGSVGRRDGTQNLEWTPAGRLLYGAINRQSLSIWTMEADGNNQTQLTSAGYMDCHLSAPDDGSYMVFESNRSSVTEVWRARLDGTELRRLTTGGDNAKPHVSPDGKWIAYKSLREGLRTIWRITIDGRDPRRLADKYASFPRISPDGKLIACEYAAQLDARTQLAILPSEGGQPIKLFDFAPRANLSLGFRWTPDGKAVTYRDWNNGIWKQPLDHAEPNRLEGLPEEKLFLYSWSKDGKQFAFVRGSPVRDVVLIRELRGVQARSSESWSNLSPVK
jgi:Tol biopolymer transport system component/DNA-binding winged helix-turn-helix (wHTH) protein